MAGTAVPPVPVGRGIDDDEEEEENAEEAAGVAAIASVTPAPPALNGGRGRRRVAGDTVVALMEGKALLLVTMHTTIRGSIQQHCTHNASLCTQSLTFLGTLLIACQLLQLSLYNTYIIITQHTTVSTATHTHSRTAVGNRLETETRAAAGCFVRSSASSTVNSSSTASQTTQIKSVC